MGEQVDLGAARAAAATARALDAGRTQGRWVASGAGEFWAVTPPLVDAAGDMTEGNARFTAGATSAEHGTVALADHVEALAGEVARLRPLTQARQKHGRGIYIASKAMHGERWRALRASGVPIIATWIDESGEGETSDWGALWTRSVEEAAGAAAVLVYNEPGERMKGALSEIGAALAAGTPVFWAGPDVDPEGKEYTVVRHPLVTRCLSFKHALRLASAAAALAEAVALPAFPPPRGTVLRSYRPGGSTEVGIVLGPLGDGVECVHGWLDNMPDAGTFTVTRAGYERGFWRVASAVDSAVARALFVAHAKRWGADSAAWVAAEVPGASRTKDEE